MSETVNRSSSESKSRHSELCSKPFNRKDLGSFLDLQSQVTIFTHLTQASLFWTSLASIFPDQRTKHLHTPSGRPRDRLQAANTALL